MWAHKVQTEIWLCIDGPTVRGATRDCDVEIVAGDRGECDDNTIHDIVELFDRSS
jgi:hypothetical protein